MKPDKEILYQYISAVYNLPEGSISQALKQELFEAAKRLNKADNLYIFSEHLAIFVNAEITALTAYAPKELVELANYMIKLQENRRLADLGLSRY